MLIRKTLRRTQPIRTHSTRQKAAALGAASLLALTAACGSAEDSSDGDGDADESTSSTSGSDLTEANFATEISDAQLEKQSAHFELNMSGEVQGEKMDISAAGDVEAAENPADSKMAMTMSIPMLSDMMPGMDEIEMRMLDQVAYMKMGQLTQDKFLEVDLTDGDSPLGNSFAEMPKNMDPTKMVEEFDGAVKSLDKTDETEEFDGVEATKYEMVVDMSEVENSIADLGGDLGAAPGASGMPDELPVDLWLSEDNLLYKMAMELETADLDGSIDMTFSDWGEPVDVEAPGKSEITKNSPLDGMMSGNMPSEGMA